MKKILFLLLLPFVLFAAQVDREEAEKYAVAFMRTIGLKNLQISSFTTSFMEGEALLYQLNFAEGGFIILAAEDAAFPVIGFSLTGTLNFEGDNRPLEKFLENYQSHIMRIRQQKLSNARTQEIWMGKAASLHRVTEKEKIDPLLVTKWGQEYPYNKFCPEDSEATGGYNNHVPAGCVAVAMAQIMKFWEYPARGSGEHSYVHEIYGKQSARFDSTYHWKIMKNILQPQDADSLQDAVARLIYDLGVAVEMDYGPEGSGAYSSWVPLILKENFNYSDQTRMRYKDFMTESIWIDELYTELYENRPVYYAGSGDDGGHAFIFDGYWEQEDRDFFHINWGWSGSGDGWYVLNNLNPEDMLFDENHRSVIFIEPAIPTARFTANVQEGLQPLEVLFKDLSTGNAVAWLWEFGDGDTSHAQNPTHVYVNPGPFNVTLTIVDSSGFVSETKVMENYIFVKARNELYGTIDETRILNSDMVQVLDHVTITKNGKLIIQPGVEMQFQGNYQIKNYGSLEALGSADSIITFRATDTTVGWSGILTQKTAANPVTTVLNHCQISNVKTQRVISALNGVTIQMEDVTLKNNSVILFYNIASKLLCNRIICRDNQVPVSLTLAKDNALINSYNGSNYFRNTLIAKNELEEKGVLYAFSGSVDFINATIVDNFHPDRLQPVLNINQNGRINLINSILWNQCGDEFNPADSDHIYINHSCVKSENPLGTTHILDFPQINLADYSLCPWSPCIGSGDDDTTGLAIGSVDLYGQERFFQGLDMGAVEYHGEKEERTLNFELSDTLGNNPLNVDFTTTVEEPEWDFDNDGRVDSDVPNTSWRFVHPGLYTPKLMIRTDEGLIVAAAKYLRILNSPPELVSESIDTLEFNEDEIDSSLKLYDIFRDPAGDPLTVTLQAEKVRLVSPVDSVLYFVPEENYFGLEEITLTAKDEYNSSVAAVLVLRVLPVNDPPMMAGFPDSMMILSGKKDSLDMSALVSDVDNEFADLIVSVSESGLVGTSSRESWLIFESLGWAGEDSLDIQISDGEATVAKTIQVKVLEPVEIDETEDIPTVFQLFQNFPNPFNPSTQIVYSIPENCPVQLAIYNIRGQKVTTLVEGYRPAGNYRIEWSGTDEQGNRVPAGIYFYILDSENHRIYRKMLLVK
ncbi:MAG: C10 family peptidase [Candidatus Marinimicrobia bacterium]|nr:C10 family peptidase [Candidatus Neomarinimicrobiota bacterium]